MTQPKIMCWDLETSDLKANKGFIFCGSSCDPLTMKITTFRIDKYKGYRRDLRNDRGIVTDLAAMLSDGDLWVTYYGKRFDFPFLNTRILHWRSLGYDIPHLENVPHIDLYDTARRRLALHSNRLGVVSSLLGNTNKTSLDLSIWMEAAYGDKDALEYIVEHCHADVRTLAENYLDLRPIIRAHPHLGILAGGSKQSCSSCGSQETQKRGIYVTESTKRQRLFCKDCGRWSSVAYKEVSIANNKKKKASNGPSNNQPS